MCRSISAGGIVMARRSRAKGSAKGRGARVGGVNVSAVEQARRNVALGVVMIGKSKVSSSGKCGWVVRRDVLRVCGVSVMGWVTVLLV